MAGVEAGRAPGGRPSVLEQREGRWDGHHRPVGDLEGAELEPPAVELNLCSRRDKKPLRHFNRSCLCEMQGWLSPSRCQHKVGQWPLSFLMNAQTQSALKKYSANEIEIGFEADFSDTITTL